MQAVLGSWKEIANYLGKGVRTVQRWEHDSGLPIHRPSGSSKGVVIAFPDELDKWARRQDGIADHISAQSTNQRNATAQRHITLSAEVVSRTRQLCDNMEVLKKRTNNVMELARRRRDEPDAKSHPLPIAKAQ